MEDHPTSTWEAMQNGEVFYRKQQLYTISGKLPNLGDFIVAGCRYGGPLGALYHSLRAFCFLIAVALMRDTSKLVALGSGTTAFAKAQIQIYSPAGEGILLFSVVTPFDNLCLQTLIAIQPSGTKARLSALVGPVMRDWQS